MIAMLRVRLARSGGLGSAVAAVAAVGLVCAGGAGLAGCGGRAADGPPCSAVAAKFLDLAKYDLANAKVDDATAHAVADQLPAMRDALAQACSEGHWGAQVRGCLVRANDHVAFEACEQQLTDEQRRDLDRVTTR
jgi:hypothetical protein